MGDFNHSSLAFFLSFYPPTKSPDNNILVKNWQRARTFFFLICDSESGKVVRGNHQVLDTALPRLTACKTEERPHGTTIPRSFSRCLRCSYTFLYTILASLDPEARLISVAFEDPRRRSGWNRVDRPVSTVDRYSVAPRRPNSPSRLRKVNDRPPICLSFRNGAFVVSVPS